MARAGLALAFAFAVVAVDMLLYPWLLASSLILADGARAGLGLAAGLALAAASGWDWSALGVRARPLQGWWWWARIAILLGAVGLAGAVAFVALFPHQVPFIGDPVRHAYMAGVSAPVLEEIIHRLVFCSAAAAACGRWPAIAASGIVFGALHIAYGTPDPSNMIGGFVLAWAFFRSGTILVPIALHSLGNLGLLAFNLAVAAWW